MWNRSLRRDVGAPQVGRLRRPLVLLVDGAERGDHQALVDRQRDAQRRLALEELAHLVNLAHLLAVKLRTEAPRLRSRAAVARSAPGGPAPRAPGGGRPKRSASSSSGSYWPGRSRPRTMSASSARAMWLAIGSSTVQGALERAVAHGCRSVSGVGGSVQIADKCRGAAPFSLISATPNGRLSTISRAV